jgi:hypothetical protein
VLLFNERTQIYDLIYSSSYPQPAGEDLKAWGPIVETFEHFPYPTPSMGFFDAQIMQDNNTVTPLLPGATLMGGHNPTISRDYNYSFVVRW